MWNCPNIMSNPFRQEPPLPPPDEEPPGTQQQQLRSQQAFQNAFTGPLAPANALRGAAGTGDVVNSSGPLARTLARAGALRGSTTGGYAGQQSNSPGLTGSTVTASAPAAAAGSFQQAVDELVVREQLLGQARDELAQLRRSEDALLRAARVAAADAQQAKMEASAERKFRAAAERKTRAVAEDERQARVAAAEAEANARAVIAEAQRKLEEARAVAAVEAEMRRMELERASTSEAAAWNRLNEVERRVMDLERPCAVEEEGMIWESVWKLKAEEAFKFARESLANGGSDRNIVCQPAVVQKLVDTCEHNQACQPGPWADKFKHDDNIPVIVRWATTAMRLKFGNADAHSCVAFTWLFQRGIKCQFWQWPVAQGSHFFVLVGPADENGPCSDCWVCDPWGGYCCPVSELPQQLGNLFGNGLSLATLHCRCQSMKENTPTCEAWVNECVQKQSDQLDAGNVVALPDLSTLLPFQQINALRQFAF